MPEKQLGFLFSSRKETRGKGRNIFQQTNFFKWMWRDFSKQESQQMIKIKSKILFKTDEKNSPPSRGLVRYSISKGLYSCKKDEGTSWI